MDKVYKIKNPEQWFGKNWKNRRAWHVSLDCSFLASVIWKNMSPAKAKAWIDLLNLCAARMTEVVDRSDLGTQQVGNRSGIGTEQVWACFERNQLLIEEKTPLTVSNLIVSKQNNPQVSEVGQIPKTSGLADDAPQRPYWFGYESEDAYHEYRRGIIRNYDKRRAAGEKLD